MPVIELTATVPVDGVVADVRVAVDDAGRDELAGAIDDLGPAGIAALAPTAVILPFVMTTVPFGIVPLVTVSTVAFRMAITPAVPA